MTLSFAEWMQQSGYSAGNAAYIEDLYEQYLIEPSNVAEPWQDEFHRFASGNIADSQHTPVRQHFALLAKQAKCSGSQPPQTNSAADQTSVLQLINAYRVQAHQCADVDPIHLTERVCMLELSPSFHGLGTQHMTQTFNTGSLAADEQMSLADIIDLLDVVYRGPIGAEYMHIVSTEQKRWIQQRLEGERAQLNATTEQRLAILKQLSAAEGLERYLHTRYTGQKRFSLEGSEALIPLLDDLIQRAGGQGTKEIIMGMAHRGRLNVLINVLGKSPEMLFSEFEGTIKHRNGGSSGDVKYHMGFSSTVDTPGGQVHLALAFNPSHLEIVDPVVVGAVAARQARRGKNSKQEVMPVLIHGDAAFAGQGVVMETLNMSQTHGFSVGGTVHIIINNQIGFTTSDPYNARSTANCTEVAKLVQAPIFHVNGDDPEAVLFVTRMALDFRNTFNKDVVIDLVCYRRHGHNEADEPSITQPVMYRKIREHASVRKLYADNLIKAGLVDRTQMEGISDTIRATLDEQRLLSRPTSKTPGAIRVNWDRYKHSNWREAADTALEADRIHSLSNALHTLPNGFTPHRRVEQLLADRSAMARGEKPCDWGYAETLAYASLLEEGYSLRLSGQDSGRGTFTHRHAILYDKENGDKHTPLEQFKREGVNCRIIDSLLSEEAVLGFEYGYATTDPETLVLWEAQFGDFANGAQVVIDQFISSGQAKWGRHSGLVLLLPHGYEGMGPEHSSARPERYMQLCAEHNVQLCQPTTPAQVFHMLRRQMLRPYRRPLIVFTGKSLLRHPQATSPTSELQDGYFNPLLKDPAKPDPAKVKHIVFCTGKVYYDLVAERENRKANDVALIRMEQLYPFPHAEFDAVLAKYPAKKLIWCQDEPQNQGYWDQLKHRFYQAIHSGRQLYYAGRAPAASTATGYASVHKRQQAALVTSAITGKIDPNLNRRKPG